jgi:hypothetical protein
MLICIYMYELLHFLNFRHGLTVHINVYFASFMNKHNIFEYIYLYCIRFFKYLSLYIYIFNFMFKFSIIFMCIQLFFSLLGYAAYLTRNISLYK